LLMTLLLPIVRKLAAKGHWRVFNCAMCLFRCEPHYLADAWFHVMLIIRGSYVFLEDCVRFAWMMLSLI
jgi:hypothetical protein